MAKAISAALGPSLPYLGSLDTYAPLKSARGSRCFRPGTYRYRYHNIRNILYKLVLFFIWNLAHPACVSIDSPRRICSAAGPDINMLQLQNDDPTRPAVVAVHVSCWPRWGTCIFEPAMTSGTTSDLSMDLSWHIWNHDTKQLCVLQSCSALVHTAVHVDTAVSSLSRMSRTQVYIPGGRYPCVHKCTYL
jgi:hypothetical protein